MAKLKLETSTVTRRQAVMLGLLAVALIGALYWPSDEIPAEMPSGDQAFMAAGDAGPRLPRRKQASPPEAKKWPQVELNVALRHDPFASPLLNGPPPAAPVVEDLARQQDAQLLALKQDGVSVVFRDARGIVATVGDQKLRVGDLVGGYRVAAIEMDAVVLERVKAE
jgi:hypothetical protein